MFALIARQQMGFTPYFLLLTKIAKIRPKNTVNRVSKMFFIII